ncbi:3-hydroxybenzoate 6-hydroxylase, partial [Nonomuraea sp. KM90]
CLAAELGAQPDLAGALKSYEAERTVRTARVQDTARIWGDMWHLDGVGRLLRNELFRVRDPRDYTYVDWLYA